MSGRTLIYNLHIYIYIYIYMQDCTHSPPKLSHIDPCIHFRLGLLLDLCAMTKMHGYGLS